MVHKASRIIEEVPIIFQGHPPNVKVMRDEKLPILTRIERLHSSLFHQRIRNDAQSLT